MLGRLNGSDFLRTQITGQVRIFDSAGRQVRLVTDKEYGVGEHVVAWDGGDDRGQEVSAGIYMIRLETRGFEAIRKLVRLR